VRFCSSTFGAGVNASHCPITCPKRRKQPGRYTPFALKICENILTENKKIDIFIQTSACAGEYY
jgi:hypothetical protein